MLRSPDSDGKYPLSGREYYAMKEIFAVIGAFEYSAESLKDRAELKDGIWDDMELVSKKCQTILHELLLTVPKKKLAQIETEIKNTYVTVEVRPPHLPHYGKRQDFAYVPTAALDGLIEKVMDIECFACEKQGKAIKRCSLRPMIEDTFPYDIPEPDNDGCKFCNCHIDHNDYRKEEE